MANIEQIIQDAERRAQHSFDAVRIALAGATTELAALYANPGMVGKSAVTDPAPPGPFTPATPPTLTEVVLDTTGAPGEAPGTDKLPDVMEGLRERPKFSKLPPVLVFPSRPSEMEDFTEPAPDINATLDLGEAPSMDPGEQPTRPEIVLPQQPGQLRQLQSTAPNIRTDFRVPEPPALLERIGEAPTVRDRAEPEAPQIDIPLFSAVAPAAPGDAPAEIATELIKTYRETAPAFIAALEGQLDARMEKINPEFHNQMALLEGRLRSFIVDQGTALRPEIENAIYERSKDKVSAEFRRARDSAYSDAAKRGLTLPDGAAFSAVRHARLAGADANARAAVEIAVKQAEMEQQNIQFAITTSNQLRATALQASISYHQSLVSINGQAVDVAKAVVNNIIEAYNASLKVYSAKMEGYKAEATVYEAHLRAIATTVEVYRSRISALQAMVQVDATRIEAYKAGIGALQATADLYQSQIQALVAQTGLEKLKLEAFGAEVEAYRAEAQAKAAEWQGYAAAIGGEEAKAKLYAANMDGFRALVESKRAQMEGYKVGVDAKIAGLGAERLKIEGYAAKVQAYAAKAQAKRGAWDGYSAGVSGETAKIQGYSAEVGAYAQEVAGWKAQVDANAAKISGVAAGNKARLDAYSAENAAYGEKMRAEGARTSAAMQFQQQLIAAYDAANRAAVARSESESRHYQTQVQVAIERGRLDTQVLIENAKITLAAAEGISKASLAGGEVLAGMASAAMSGMNTLVSLAE